MLRLTGTSMQAYGAWQVRRFPAFRLSRDGIYLFKKYTKQFVQHVGVRLYAEAPERRCRSTTDMRGEDAFAHRAASALSKTYWHVTRLQAAARQRAATAAFLGVFRGRYVR